MPPEKQPPWRQAAIWKGDRSLDSKRSSTERKPGSDADQGWRQGTWGAASSSSTGRWSDAARWVASSDWTDYRTKDLVPVPTAIAKRRWGSGKKYGPLRAKNLRQQSQQQRRALAHRLGQWIDLAGGFAKVDIEAFISAHCDYDTFLWNRKFVTEKRVLA